jgi:ubiquinone/menaquinone biosynthesis C-methylase UbiE
MLQHARRRCSNADLENVAFREGSATDLPFAESAFDGVVTRLSIHHFKEPRRVLDEMFRVLRPNGRLVVADVVSSKDAEEAGLQSAIETLRDPSHVRMLPRSELLSLVEGSLRDRDADHLG